MSSQAPVFDDSNNYSQGQNPGGNGMGGNLQGLLGGMLGLYGNSQFQNPASAGMNYLQGLPDQFKQMFSPYMNAGQQGLNSYQQQIANLLSNPGGMVNQMGSNFKQSPGFGFQVDQATRAANQAGAAGGMAGSPMEQQQLAGTVNNLANQDYYNYLNHTQNLFNQGFEGAGNLAQMGLGAANSYGGGLANVGNNMANLSGLQSQYNNQNMGSGLSDIGAIASYFL